MFQVIAGKNKFEGVLKNYTFHGDDLVINAHVDGNLYITLTLPSITPDFAQAIKMFGKDLERMKNSTINLNTGMIENHNVQSAKGSMEKGKKVAREHRGTMSTGKLFG